LIKIEKDFTELKIQKIENNKDLKLNCDNSLNNVLNKSIFSNSKCSSSNIEQNMIKINVLLCKKSKYKEEKTNFNSVDNDCFKYEETINNRNFNKENLKYGKNFDCLHKDQEKEKPNLIQDTIGNKRFFASKNNKYDKEDYLNFMYELEKNKTECYNLSKDADNLNNENNEKNINQSFQDYIIDIDMSNFKNLPNNQNFFNSELEDIETINTTRNSNFDDLSISFITEYSNKNLSGNVISNAIQSEKLMMKLFDICNPALQPNEK